MLLPLAYTLERCCAHSRQSMYAPVPGAMHFRRHKFVSNTHSEAKSAARLRRPRCTMPTEKGVLFGLEDHALELAIALEQGLAVVI